MRLIVLILAFATATSAQPGTVDRAFGADGVVTIPTGFLPEHHATGVAGDDQGRVVVIGFGGLLSGRTVALGLARFLSDGTPDLAFGKDGFAELPIPIATYRQNRPLARVAVTDEGIVVATSADVDGQRVFALVRVLENGSPDPSFGTDGVVYTRFSGLAVAAVDVVALADGRLVAVGTAQADGDLIEVAVARYLPDGQLDLSFGDEGRATFDLGPGNDVASAVASDVDGRVVIAATVYSAEAGGQASFAVLRLAEGGELDAGFGDGGVRQITEGPGGVEVGSVSDLVIRPNGSPALAGFVYSPTSARQFTVASLTADGDLDTAFGNQGLTVTDFPGSSFAFGITSDSAGRLVAVGRDGFSGGNVVAIRYQSDGTPDPAFGQDGIVRSFRTFYRTLAVTAIGDGVVVVGEAGIPGGSGFAVVRLGEDGAPDPTFAGGLAVRRGLGEGARPVDGLAVGPSNKPVAVHCEITATGTDLVVSRYRSDGVLDSSFGDDGRVSLGNALGCRAQLTVLDDQSVVLGTTGVPGVAVLDRRGDLVPERVDAITALVPDLRVTSVAQLPDGRIVLAGCGGTFIRLLPDATPDPAFGTNGVAHAPRASCPDAVALLPDGAVLAVTEYETDYIDQFSDAVVVRVGPDGVPDASFGGDGGVLLNLGARDGFYAIVGLSDGVAVAVGSVSSSRGTVFAPTDLTLAALDAEGNLVAAFGDAGVARPFGTRTSAADAMALPDGSLLVLGTVDGAIVTRIFGDGTVDTGYGNDGVAAVGLPDVSVQPTRLAVGPDGRVVVALQTSTGAALVRLGPYMGVPTEPAPHREVVSMSVYPSPSSSRVAVEVEAVRGLARVEVFDLLGRLVAVLHDGPATGTLQLVAEVSTWPSGLYVVRVSGSMGTASVQLVVAR